jgi:hypothetical protein
LHSHFLLLPHELKFHALLNIIPFLL